MYLIAIGWLYVALMMSVAEATNTNGTILGAIFTFLMYGVLPTALVVYILSTPQRRRNRQAREDLQAQQAQPTPPRSGPEPVSGEPDAGSHATTDPVAPVRKEP